MAQSWTDLLFAHWRVDPAALSAQLPEGVVLDTRAGEAWLGVVPFRMEDVRLRYTPRVPCTHSFPELNVRTYVTVDGTPGVWFFSLDATNSVAVAVARRWFHLPYYRARMACVTSGAEVEYTSERTHRGAPPARFAARYQPTGPVATAAAGSLEHWLTERYCLFAPSPRGLLRGDIHHAPWPLQPARAAIRDHQVAASAGIGLPATAPLLHFARRVDVVCWAPRRV